MCFPSNCHSVYTCVCVCNDVSDHVKISASGFPKSDSRGEEKSSRSYGFSWAIFKAISCSPSIGKDFFSLSPRKPFILFSTSHQAGMDQQGIIKFIIRTDVVRRSKWIRFVALVIYFSRAFHTFFSTCKQYDYKNSQSSKVQNKVRKICFQDCRVRRNNSNGTWGKENVGIIGFYRIESSGNQFNQVKT